MPRWHWRRVSGFRQRRSIQVTDFSALPPPAALEDSVDKVIDQTLERRPDLIAKVAALRGKEAEVRRARAAYFPTLSLVSNVNTIAGRVKVTGGNQPTGWFSAAEPSYGAGLAIQVEHLRGRRHPEKSGTRRGRAPGRRSEVTPPATRLFGTCGRHTRTCGSRCAGSMSPRRWWTLRRSPTRSTLESYRRGLETLMNLLGGSPRAEPRAICRVGHKSPTAQCIGGARV